MALSIVLSSIFSLLSLIHFNWAIGGKFGFEASIPRTLEGENLFTPGKLECIVVALGLLGFSYFYAANTTWIPNILPNWVSIYGGWIIPSIFMIRAIGDFKYAGFFKRVKGTKFAYWDTRLFSPLCLCLGVSGYLIQYWS